MAYVIGDNCVNCGTCADACPLGIISEGDGKYVIDADQCVECGTCAAECLNPDEHIVTANGARVELTYKEYELLRLFLQHPGMAFTRDQLMEKVWGTDYYGETRTIDMHIRTLRQKLGGANTLPGRSWILESGMLTGLISGFVGSRAFSSAMWYLQN